MHGDPEGAGRSVRHGALAVLLLSAWAAPLHAQLQVQAQEAVVDEVTFRGNETFPDDSLASAIATRETVCRSRWLLPFCWLEFGFAERTTPLRGRELTLDRARLMIWYQRRGFLDVQVDTPSVLSTPGHTEVVFELAEGRPVIAQSIDYEGPLGAMNASILSGLPLRQGNRLSAIERVATQDTLRRRLRNQGYAHADVYFRALRPADDPYNAQVTFNVQPGPIAAFGEIDVSGLDNLSPGTVRRTLQFEEGDVYRDSDVEAARTRLFGLEIVRSARIDPDLTAFQDSVVPIRVQIQESDAYRVRGGIGGSQSECLSVEARWASRNFLGGARVLQVRGRIGNILAEGMPDPLCNQAGTGRFAEPTWTAAVDLSQPWIFSTNNSFAASVFAERQTLPPDLFVRRAVGFQMALTRTLSPGTTLAAYWRPEFSKLDADDVLFCTGFLVCDPDDVELLERANWLAPVGIAYTRDRSNDLLNPSAGSRILIEVEHAAAYTGSSWWYDRVVLEARRYDPLGESWVLAGRLRGGWVGQEAFEAILTSGPDASIVHPQRRFFAGGANSVRGFAQSRLGPRVLVSTNVVELLTPFDAGGAGCQPEQLTADQMTCDLGMAADSGQVTLLERPTGGTRVIEGNAELRFPLGGWLEGVAFADIGQAWGLDQPVGLGQLEVTPGFGVRFPSPVGPIRIDLAYRSRGTEPLPVVAPVLRPFDSSVDMDSDKIEIDGTILDWVGTGQTAFLSSAVPFLESASRWQLHLSIGQAF
jgi:outer membrane protein assembly factor BamA